MASSHMLPHPVSRPGQGPRAGTDQRQIWHRLAPSWEVPKNAAPCTTPRRLSFVFIHSAVVWSTGSFPFQLHQPYHRPARFMYLPTINPARPAQKADGLFKLGHHNNPLQVPPPDRLAGKQRPRRRGKGGGVWPRKQIGRSYIARASKLCISGDAFLVDTHTSGLSVNLISTL